MVRPLGATIQLAVLVPVLSLRWFCVYKGTAPPIAFKPSRHSPARHNRRRFSLPFQLSRAEGPWGSRASTGRAAGYFCGGPRRLCPSLLHRYRRRSTSSRCASRSTSSKLTVARFSSTITQRASQGWCLKPSFSSLLQLGQHLFDALVDLTHPQPGAAAYGNLALLNSSRMKYTTNIRTDAARRLSASHVLYLMVMGDTSTTFTPSPTVGSANGFRLEPPGR
jgi:hypothetical protein